MRETEVLIRAGELPQGMRRRTQMVNRLFIVVAAIALPIVLGGLPADAADPDPDRVDNNNNFETSTDTVIADASFQALPDKDENSAKFLVLSGLGNNTTGEQCKNAGGMLVDQPVRTIIKLDFERPGADDTPMQIALFDPNVTGKWDQFAPDSVLLQHPRVQFDLFLDKQDGMDVAAAVTEWCTETPQYDALPNRITRLLETSSDASPDNAWAAFFDMEPAAFETLVDNQFGGNARPDDASSYKFVMVISLLPAFPGGLLQGTERCGHKVAFNSTYLIPGGSILGFSGGIIDQRYPFINQGQVPQGQTMDPMPGEPLPPPSGGINQYDGTFDFFFHNTRVICPDTFIFGESDADWNPPILRDENEANDPDCDFENFGIPADHGGVANDPNPDPNLESGCHSQLAFGMGGEAVTDLRDNTAFRIGDAVRWAITPTPVSDPFAAGFNGVAYSSEPLHPLATGMRLQPTNGLQPIHASVNNDRQDQVLAIQVLDNGAGADAWTTDGDDQYLNIPLDKDHFKANPGANNLWSVRFAEVDAGNFIFLKMSEDFGTTPEDCDTTIEACLGCDDDGDCEIDRPLHVVFPGKTIVVTATGPGLGGGVELTLNPDTDCYEFTSGELEPNAVYNVTVTVDGVPSSTVTMPALKSPEDCPGNENPCVINTPESLPPKLPPCTFIYECPIKLSGCLVCDTDGDCIGDEDLPLGTLVTVTISGGDLPIDGNASSYEATYPVTIGDFTTCWEFISSADEPLTPGETYDVTVSVTPPPNTTIVLSNCPNNDNPREVTVPPTGQMTEVTGIDFIYDCDTPKVFIKIWCERSRPKPGNSEFDEGVDVPCAGILVDVIDKGTNQTIRQVSTDLNGEICLDDENGNQLPFGEYNLCIDPASLAPGSSFLNPLDGCCMIEVVPGGEQQDCFFQLTCPVSICGTVYCGPAVTSVGGPGPLNGVPPNPPQSPLPGAVVQLNPGGFTEVTDANGFYCFSDDDYDLPPGNYTVTILTDPLPPPGEVFCDPAGPFPSSHLVELGKVDMSVDNNFGYCCEPPPTCDIKVKVCCDADCDGVCEPGEPGVPGVKIMLSPGDRMGTTDADGCVEFLNLVPGTYTVTIDESSVPADKRLCSDRSKTVVCPDGGAARVEFLVCPLGSIKIQVWKEPVDECDCRFDDGDIPINKARLVLTDANGTFIQDLETDAFGCVKVKGLLPGDYCVEIEDTFELRQYWCLCKGERKQCVTIDCGEEERVEFGYCCQEVCGKVWLDCDCDGMFWMKEGDLCLEGVVVEIIGIGGFALDVGYRDTTTTDADGLYCFENVPTGEVEVRILQGPGNASYILQDPKVYTPTVECGVSCRDKDFRYCKCEQWICVRVFGQPKGKCDDKFDEGVDTNLEWIKVDIKRKGSDKVISTGFTDRWGVCCWSLPPGCYDVCVSKDQPQLKDWEPCEGESEITTLCLEPCETLWATYCYCEKCPNNPCCEGDLHEVTLETKIWVGDEDCFQLGADFRDGCSPWSDELDSVWVEWKGAFPGRQVGHDGVLIVENVVVRNGIATVTLKLIAQKDWFYKGRFGDRERRVAVEINGCEKEGCAIFRCEHLRPGAMFDWTDGCPEMPECDLSKDKDWWLRQVRDDWNDCKYDASFLVVDTWSWESWRWCEPCESTEMRELCVIDFWIGDRDDHTFRVKAKDGSKVLADIRVEFDGDHWDDGKRDGFLKVAKIWRVSGDHWRARVRIDFECDCWHDVTGVPQDLLIWAELDDCAHDKNVWLDCRD